MTECNEMTQKGQHTAAPKLRFPEFRNAPGWTSKELRSIANPVSERASDEDENNILTLSAEHGLVLQSEYFGKQVAGTNAERYYKIQRDDFVYNDRTTKASEYGTIKRLTKYPHGIVSLIYKCFRFQADETPIFWEYYFESGAHDWQLRNLANEGARAGRFNVTIERFLSTRVCSPPPISGEQQKIAECLSRLDELIEAESRKLDALKAHKKGLMQRLFPREGETVPQLRFPEFRKAPGWNVCALSTLISSLDAGVSVNGGDRPASKSELGVLKTSAVTNGFFEPNENKVVLEATEQARLAEPVQADTIIISRMNTPALVGASAYVHKSIPNLFLPDRLWAAKPRENVSMRFLSFVLGSDWGRTALAALATGTSGSMKNISKQDVLNLPVKVPTFHEQVRIAACLSSLDDLITEQIDKLAALRAHKRGLLQQLFPSRSEIEP